MLSLLKHIVNSWVLDIVYNVKDEDVGRWEYQTIDQFICFYSRRKRWYFDEFVII